MNLEPQREEALFQAAAQLAGSSRAAFLDQACAGDVPLRARLEALLTAHEASSGLLGNEPAAPFGVPPSGGPANPPAKAGTPNAPTLDLPEPVADEAVGMTLGRYKLREKLGEGGCGTVYVAEQTEPVRRRVALKVIKLGMDTREVIARFEAERQALAMMDHPNIAKVLDAGTTGADGAESQISNLRSQIPAGRPYFVMELVRGIRITDYCDQANLTTKERLDLFIKVCQAIQHAHQKGIIHRDIKPGNILVTLHDGVPVPKVIDFGIAKATEGRLTDNTVYTQLHHFMGTPAYMSPEQAEMSGLDIDTRSDIYSLGVLLYELLTGRTPFDPKELMASGLDAMRKTIREQEPVRPSTRLTQALTLGVPPSGGPGPAKAGTPNQDTARIHRLKALIATLRGDLDWIVMKSLEKDRARRYETANALAQDIQRHLTNEPIIARPPSATYRFNRLVRRNKLAFAAAGAVAAAVLIGLFFASWQALRATNAERAARRAEQAQRSLGAQARADRDRAVKAESESREQADAANNAWATARRNAYAAEIHVAFQALAENNLGRARELLDRQRPKAGEEDLRGFEWRHLWQRCQGDELATFRDDGVHAAAYSPDGRSFACAGGKIFVRESASRKLIATLDSSATTLSFSPRGKLLASGHDSGVKLWDTGTWQEGRALPDTTVGCRFSPDGRWLLTGINGGWRLWNTETWQPAGDCPGAPPSRWHGRNAVAFSPDSQFVVTGAYDVFEIGDHLRVWRLPGREELPPVRFGGFAGGIPPISAAFSADGKHLIVGYWTGQIVVWEFATRRMVTTLFEHSGSVTSVSVAADGRTFVTTSTDRTVNVWDATRFNLLVRLRGHVGEVWSGALSPDGRAVISGSAEDTIKLWSTETRHADTILNGAGVLVGFLSGGRQLVSATTNRLNMWSPESGARVEFPAPPSLKTIGRISARAYDLKPDDPVFAVGCGDGAVELWPLAPDPKAITWPAHDEAVGAVAFSADGKRLATTSTKGEVKIWDAETRRETAHTEPVGRNLVCLAFSPDGRTLAGAGASSRVWIWDTATGRVVVELGGHGNAVPTLAFSPDGRLLVTTAMPTDDVHLWELPSGEPVATLKGHVQGVIGVAFSPDGKTLATASHDRKVKLWNVATHQELVTFSFAAHLISARFSPDGRSLAVGYFNERGMHIELIRAPGLEQIAAAESSQTTDSPR